MDFLGGFATGILFVVGLYLISRGRQKVAILDSETEVEGAGSELTSGAEGAEIFEPTSPEAEAIGKVIEVNKAKGLDTEIKDL